MGFFTKKIPQPVTTVQKPVETLSDVDIKESLYKQNRQLAVTNKTLSLLRQLYQISLTSFNSETLGRDLVDTIRTVLEFDFVGIFIHEPEQDSLRLLTSSQSKRLLDIYIKYSNPSDPVRIPNVSKDSFFGPILEKKELRYNDSILHLDPHTVVPEVMKKIEADSHIKATIGYPLIIDNKAIGVLVISLNRIYEDLFPFERDSLATFADVIAIALDRSRLYADLETANSKQENLLHFISHEIKGYLTKNQSAFASLIEGDYGSISNDAKELSKMALADTRKGVETVMNILDASNLKKGTTKYVVKPFDLKPLVEEIVKDLSQKTAQHGLKMAIDLKGNNFIINGDKEQLGKHVIKNLIENAINYTPKGHISVGLEQKEKSILFYVKDTGIGISEEDRALLFTEGGHGKESRKINVMSTGYGLFIAKGIVTAHKGKIWAESEGIGKGSQFYMELPL